MDIFDRAALLICCQNSQRLEPASCRCCWAGESSCLHSSVGQMYACSHAMTHHHHWRDTPRWETTISATAISATNDIGHRCTISATHNVDISHKLTKINKTEWKWNAGHSMASLLHVSRANPVHMCSINRRIYGRSIAPEHAPWTAGLLRACFLPVLFVSVTLCLTIDRLCRLAYIAYCKTAYFMAIPQLATRSLKIMTIS